MEHHAVVAFVHQLAPLIQRAQQVQVQTAARFNLFEALGIVWKEQPLSHLLAFLLDPTETHEQGALFLHTFLHEILQCETLPDDVPRTEVRTEVMIEPYGRVDIRLQLPDGRLVVIEHKVYAREGTAQIARYQAWLRRQPSPAHGCHLLVFLTPRGEPPQTGKPDEVCCVSYRQLGQWIEARLGGLPDRLQIVLTQYAEHCRVVGGARRETMTDELHTLLTEPANLDMALEVAAQVADIRETVFRRFWQQVLEAWTTQLVQHGYQTHWVADCSDDLLQPYAALGLYWRNDHEQFAVLLESPAGTQEGAYYGISRGKKVRPQSRVRLDRALTNHLRDAGFVTDDGESGWVGWKYVSDLHLPAFLLTEKEHVLRLNQDNRDPAHPLAQEVVELLWSLFDNHRAVLEQLNTRYPY